MSSYELSGETQSSALPGVHGYTVHCEHCFANLGPAGEGIGPSVVAGLSAPEIISRLLKKQPPFAETAEKVRQHEAACPAAALREPSDHRP